MAAPRVVSFLPSATEIVHALGLGETLVARSHECDHPPEVRKLPIAMRARRDFSRMDSAAIDAAVKATRGRGRDLYEVDASTLRALAPDVIITQDLCGVCAVTPASLAAALEGLSPSPQVVTLSPARLRDILRDIETTAKALGYPERGRAIVAQLKRRLAALAVTPPARPRPKVLVLEWLEPPIVAGLWTPDLIRAAGGRPLLVPPGERFLRTSWDAVRASGADLIVVSPCAFPVARTMEELARRTPHPLQDLHPARGVWVADEAFFSRPGPRVVDGAELLSDLLSGPGRPRREFAGRVVPAFRPPRHMTDRPSRRHD